MQRRWESGDIISGWLLRLLVLMAAISYVVFELVTVGINAIQAEDIAQETARTAARAYQQSDGRLDAAERAADEKAAERGARFVDLEVADDLMHVVVRRDADTLLIHEISLFNALTRHEAVSKVRMR